MCCCVVGRRLHLGLVSNVMGCPGSRQFGSDAVVRRLSVVFLAAILVGGCASSLLPKPVMQENHTHVLEWPGEGAVPVRNNPVGPKLLVAPMLAAPGFGGSGMAYMRTPHQVEYFAKHRWADAPARMLEPLLVRAAARTGRFRSVAGAGGGLGADLRLDSKLLHLQQVCRLNPSELQLALQVSLVDVPSAQLLATQTLSVSEPIHERGPVAGVQAANRAVARLLTEVQTFLVKHAGEARD